MLQLIYLIARGGAALIREAAGAIAHSVTRFERVHVSRLADFPAAALDAWNLLVHIVVKNSGETTFVFALTAALLLLFLLLR